MTVMSLGQLAKKFAKEYAVVSLKFVKSQLEHPDHPHANANAEDLLKKAGFAKGRQVRLADKANACGYTTATCYWRKNYFDNKMPDYQIMKEMANQKLGSEFGPVALTFADPEEIQAAQAAYDKARLGIPKDCTIELPQAPEAPIFEAAPLIVAFRHLRDEAIKTYLRTLPPSHQRVFCSLYESVFQDLNGYCALTDEEGTVHTLAAVPMSEDARRYYSPLINMFYQDEEMWGPIILWLELHGKPDPAQGWKSLLQPPYSESLRSAYFFLTDLDKLIQEDLASLTGLN
ncbi:hypothetical protein JI675_004988 [Escherichia coli]|nr:hypothetical protein [Escherichia coli]